MRLSTPHGALGTYLKILCDPHLFAFNSTRCIRKIGVLVAIPHGGLRARIITDNEAVLKASPSHTVGLERFVRVVRNNTIRMSPSHTVGSEQVVPQGLLPRVLTSPSHPVGLELRKTCFTASRLTEVTIPHGGLRTVERYLFTNSF